MTSKGATLPSKPGVLRVFCPLQRFKVRVHLQPNVSHSCTWKSVILKHFKWIPTLQIFRSPAKKWKEIIKMWYTVNENSFSLTLREMNIILNECGLYECGLKWSGLKWMWSQMNVVSNECGLKWMWSQRNVVSNESGLKWVWSQMNMVSNDCGLKWMWSQMTVVTNKLSQINVVAN